MMNDVEYIQEYIKRLENAVIDLTDGISPMEIQRFTGQSVERCVELKELGNELIKN